MNPDYERDVLKNWINRILDDTASPFLPRSIVFPYDDIRLYQLEWFREWEKRGILRFLKDPVTSKADDMVIEMLSYIDRSSPIPGFLNWKAPEPG